MGPVHHSSLFGTEPEKTRQSKCARPIGEHGLWHASTTLSAGVASMTGLAPHRPRFCALIFAATLGAGSVACGPSAELESVGSSAAGVIYGDASSDAQDAVVLLIEQNQIDGSLGYCTGSIVSKTLILTARHCLFDVSLPLDNGPYFCTGGDTSFVRSSKDPKTFTVHTGKQKPAPEAAQGVNIYSGRALGLCSNDVALLEVDTPLPIEPLALRLDEPPGVGEVGTLVGWGDTEANLGQVSLHEVPKLTPARRQRDITVLAVGPYPSYPPPGGAPRDIEAAAFLTTTGGCYGDSGSPLISRDTGAIIGVFSAVNTLDVTGAVDVKKVDDCLGALGSFEQLVSQQDWIREAFRQVGAAPWIEGRPTPVDFGQSCEISDDCVSGLCVSAGGSHFCSQHCETTSCPAGMDCVGPASSRVCSLPQVQSSESRSSGCAMSTESSPEPGWAGLALSLLATRRFRRSWRTKPKSKTTERSARCFSGNQLSTKPNSEY
jgi:Trypsin